jgi:hypothetical protein
MVLAATALGLPAAAGDLPAATMLFNEGRRLAASGQYVDACPKFEESQRLDPGIGTQFNLADCFEHTGRPASAWALFLDVASAAGGSEQRARELVARKRAAALEPRLSKLTIEAPSGVAGLEVRRNGETVNRVLWNSAVPVDPGTYTIEATAPGRKRWSTVAAVGPEASHVTVVIPTLEDEATAPTDALGASAPSTPAATSFPPSERAFEAWHPSVEGHGPQRTIALALGGAAIAGAGLGAYFGLRSFAKHSDYESLCAGGVCGQAAAPLHADAVTAGNLSTASFIASGALAAGAIAVWFSAPKPARSAGVQVAPLVGSSAGGVTIAGDW